MKSYQELESMQILPDLQEDIVTKIKERKWWQGALVNGGSLGVIDDSIPSETWWVIASQTCNLYNPSFDNVPVFELVAAKEVDSLKAKESRGDHPRIFHATAISKDKNIFLEIDIQKRIWCKRCILAELEAPEYKIVDIGNVETDGYKSQWLDKFSGWLARSYTRTTLPDEFNEAIKKSKLADVFDNKIPKFKEHLYGIYFSIRPDSDEEFFCAVGELNPPYQLELCLVVNEDIDPDEVKDSVIKQIFTDKVQDPADKDKTVTRAELAGRFGVHIIPLGVDVKSVTEVTLSDIHTLIRYSNVDYLSDSIVAATTP